MLKAQRQLQNHMTTQRDSSATALRAMRDESNARRVFEQLFESRPFACVLAGMTAASHNDLDRIL
jgi:hypothetical protein